MQVSQSLPRNIYQNRFYQTANGKLKSLFFQSGAGAGTVYCPIGDSNAGGSAYRVPVGKKLIVTGLLLQHTNNGTADICASTTAAPNTSTPPSGITRQIRLAGNIGTNTTLILEFNLEFYANEYITMVCNLAASVFDSGILMGYEVDA